MTIIRQVIVEGIPYEVTLSDDREALLAAQAAKRAVVAIGEGEFYEIPYVAEDWDAVSTDYLERVVRRDQGLPWMIGETRRLLIREFTPQDACQVPLEPEAGAEDVCFRNPEQLKAYIQNQYRFYEFGIWALVEKQTGTLVGKAGLSVFTFEGQITELDSPLAGEALELGYHIFRPFRRNGFALEACARILQYGWEQFALPVYAKIDAGNLASMRLARQLGFVETGRIDNGSGLCRFLYEWRPPGWKA